MVFKDYHGNSVEFPSRCFFLLS